MALPNAIHAYQQNEEVSKNHLKLIHGSHRGTRQFMHIPNSYKDSTEMVRLRDISALAVRQWGQIVTFARDPKGKLGVVRSFSAMTH